MPIEFINGKYTVYGPHGDVIGRFSDRDQARKAAGSRGEKAEPDSEDQPKDMKSRALKAATALLQGLRGK